MFSAYVHTDVFLFQFKTVSGDVLFILQKNKKNLKKMLVNGYLGYLYADNEE